MKQQMLTCLHLRHEAQIICLIKVNLFFGHFRLEIDTTDILNENFAKKQRFSTSKASTYPYIENLYLIVLYGRTCGKSAMQKQKR